MVDDNLYIIPSSIHEVIVMPESECEKEELAELVHYVNMTEVSLEERLSNQVYFYDRNTKDITIATDAPKKLD